MLKKTNTVSVTWKQNRA